MGAEEEEESRRAGSGCDICGTEGGELTNGWCWFSAFNGAGIIFLGVSVPRLMRRTTMVSAFLLRAISGYVMMSMCWGSGAS